MQQLPTNTIIHCNSVDGMKRLPDECIPLTVTSPPYGDMRTYGHEVGGYTWDVFTSIAEQLARITMIGGEICWVLRNQIRNRKENCQAEREKLFFVDQLGLSPFQTIIGVPTGCPITNKRHGRYVANCDYIYILCKGANPRHVRLLRDKRNKLAGTLKRDRKIREADGTERMACSGDYKIAKLGYRTNVWPYNTGGGHTATDDHISSGHPARMPEKLAEDLIVSFSKPGDLVFDPFAGAGTTPKMAMLNNRKFLGMEMNQEYVDIIHRRLAHAEKIDRVKRLNEFLKRFKPDSQAA